MRMFGYYIFHTFINQIRKLFKTWVMIVVACSLVLGIVIGFGSAMVMDKVESSAYTAEVDDNGNATGRYLDDEGEVYLRYKNYKNNYFYVYEEDAYRCIELQEAAEGYTADGRQLTQDLKISSIYRDTAGVAWVYVTDDSDHSYAMTYIDYDLYMSTYSDDLYYPDEYDLYVQEFPQGENEDIIAVEDEVIEVDRTGLTFRSEDGTEYTFTLAQIIEGVTLVSVLLIIIMFAFTADQSGGKIFLMADVNALFSSPMKPQSVLMMRLMTKLGSILLLMIFYSAVYMPNMLHIAQLTVPGVVLFFLTIFFAVGFGMLAQLFIYMFCATHPEYKKYVKTAVYALILAAPLSFSLYWKTTGMELFPALLSMGSMPMLRVLPIAGWIKAAMYYVFSGNLGMALVWTAVLIVGMVVITYLIWQFKADFYEDAMTKSEEIAQMQQAMQEKGSIIANVRKKKKEGKKEKPDRAERGQDGFRYGMGASMFMHKALHTRFRFAFLHYFTKTCDTYLFTAAVIAVFGRLVFHFDGFIAGIAILGAMCFFRSISNPLGEDINTNTFRMSPDSTGSKLFWALFGGMLNCLLDLLPAVALLTIVFLKNPLYALGSLVLLMSAYMFAICTGAFMDISIPAQGSTTIKQTMQVMFMYFGMLPDIVLLAVGFATEHVVIFAMLAIFVNMIVSLIFLLLTAEMLEPKEGTLAIYANSRMSISSVFSGIGWGLVLLYVLGAITQLVAMIYYFAFSEELVPGGVGSYLVTFLPLYLIGFPLGMWWISRQPKVDGGEHEPFGLLRLGKCFLIACGLAYACSFAGELLNSILIKMFGSGMTNVIEEFVTEDSIVLQLIFLVIAAPILEELVFRKLIIDRTRAFGEKQAIFYSAVLFGLFHGNLVQSLYAFAFGLVLAYVYVKSGKIQYSIAMHMGFNFMGSITAGYISRSGNAALQGMYDYFIIGLIVIGILLLLANLKKIHLRQPEHPATAKHMWANSGMIAFLLMMGSMIVLTFIQSFLG